MKALALAALAQTPPAWWTTRGVFEPNAAPDDYMAINQGQLKNLARAAFEEMQARLPGGAGPELAALIASWDNPGPQTDDYAVVSAGQLATLGALFYGRLDAIRLQWAPGWASIARPALDMQSAATADQIVNTGQAKHLFAGLEGDRHLHPADLQNASVNPSDFAFGLAWLQDGDEDGTPDFQQVAFYTGHTPWLVIVSGAGQAVAHDEVSAAPVVIRAAQGYASPLASRTYLLMRRSSGNVLDYANYELLEWLATTTTYTRAGPAFPSVQIGGVFDFDYAYYLGDDENGNPIHDSEPHRLPLDGEPFMRKVTLTIPAGGVQSQTFMVDAAHLAIFNPLTDEPAKETLLVPETAPNSCYLADCFLLPVEIKAASEPYLDVTGSHLPKTGSADNLLAVWSDGPKGTNLKIKIELPASLAGSMPANFIVWEADDYTQQIPANSLEHTFSWPGQFGRKKVTIKIPSANYEHVLWVDIPDVGNKPESDGKWDLVKSSYPIVFWSYSEIARTWSESQSTLSPAKRDALKHAYWCALGASDGRLGRHVTLDYARTHEYSNKENDQQSTNPTLGAYANTMDLHNNNEGASTVFSRLVEKQMSASTAMWILVPDEAQIQQALLQKLSAGDLMIWDGAGTWGSNKTNRFLIKSNGTKYY